MRQSRQRWTPAWSSRLRGGDFTDCSGDEVVRTLRARGAGRFRSVGRASVTTTTGRASWVVADRCDGTLTRVRRGHATVLDIGLGEVMTLTRHGFISREEAMKPTRSPHTRARRSTIACGAAGDAMAFSVTVINSGQTIVFSGEPGEVNTVTVTLAAGEYTFTDTTATATVVSPACTGSPGSHTVTCPAAGVTSLSISLGDMTTRRRDPGHALGDPRRGGR